MNKRRNYILFFILLFLSAALSGCTTGSFGEADVQPEETWTARFGAFYPFQVGTEINSLLLQDHILLAAGNNEQGPQAALLNVTGDNGGYALEKLCDIPLDGLPYETSYQYAAVYHDGSFYLLLGEARDRFSRGDYSGEYTLLEINLKGETVSRQFLDFGSEAMPYGMLSIDGRLYIWNLEGLLAVDIAQRSATFVFEASGEMWPVVESGDSVYAQINEAAGGTRTFCLEPFANGCDAREISALEGMDNISRTQAPDGNLLINDGYTLQIYNGEYEKALSIDLYQALGEYGESYKQICQLDEDTFIFSRTKSDELLIIDFAYKVDDRQSLRVAGYSADLLGQQLMAEYVRQFNRSQTAYLAQMTDYSEDDNGLEQLKMLCSSRSAPDIVLSDGQIAPGRVFEDLTAYLDADAAVGLEEFPQSVISALKGADGLYALWSAYLIQTLTVYGELSQTDGLTLETCIDEYNTSGFYGNLFGMYTSKETLFTFLSPHLISAGIKGGAFRVDRPALEAVLAACRHMPDKLTDAYFSEAQGEPLLCVDDILSLDRIKGISGYTGGAYCFFDGVYTAENDSLLSCAWGSCMMMPGKAENKEAAWEFIRFCMSADGQRRVGRNFGAELVYSSPGARSAALSGGYSAEDKEKLESLIQHALVYTQRENEMTAILTEQFVPYLRGDKDLENCIQNAENRLQLYISEHG